MRLDILDRADTAFLVRNFDVVAAYLDSGQRQPLIVIDFAPIIILALVGPQAAAATRQSAKIE